MIVEIFKDYKKVTPEEGMVLTSYKDGDDILTYSSCRIMYTPLFADLSSVREISVAEDEEMQKQIEEIMLKN